ncbi:1-phosphofructokinase family hexose kinase [Kocuria marina subsp. indica]|uniref:1-phosphofructokinase family hexose kinase n=1 Tax=Kocuria TaxID=57493 RepID=UPI00103ADCCC|nr:MULTISPECIES: 1-phosphofructokinase family hexose kinase [Kocuria]MDT0118754.1 1-phosphofructokinase family hexose kinase [Kocuria sp. PD6]QBJ22061.1 1-phosphofructokinase family hexose kinase [Kocuria indica]
MIITVTLNPSVDRTVDLPGPLARGRVQRASDTRQDPGGKGVNISRALAASGVDTVAVVPGDGTDPLFTALDAAGVRYDSVSIGAPVRSNITVTEPDGTTTKINEPGPPLDEHTVDRIVERIVSRGAGAQWLVFAGSVPPGPAPDVYAVLAARVSGALGAAAPSFALDTSGDVLRAALAPGVAVLPDVIKPNGHELAELLGRTDGDALEADPRAAADAGRELVARGVGAVLCTLGGNGAVLVTPEGAWHAVHEPVTVRSTVGAGDSALTGYLVATQRGEAPAERLRRAVAHGSAAAALPGTQMPTVAQTTPDAVRVTQLTSARQSAATPDVPTPNPPTPAAPRETQPRT